MRKATYIIMLLTLTSCEPSFHLFLSNEATEEKEVKVFVGDNLPDSDSIKFFSLREEVHWKSYDSATTLRRINKDSTEGTYRFTIRPGEITLLQPLTIGTCISRVIIENDTTLFHSNKNILKDQRFVKIGKFKYLKTIK